MTTPVQQAVADLGPWFHNLHLPDATQTAPDHFLGGDFPANKWRCLAPHLPDDLPGWRALDIGCNAGFYSFELARRGAHVTATDVNDHYLAQARWAASQFGLADRITFLKQSVYDLARTGETFDLVLFLGVFYHLRYAPLALDIVAQAAKRLLAFQSLTAPGTDEYPAPEDIPIDQRDALRDPGWPMMAFIEHRLAGDPTNWWAPSHAGVLALLRSAGMRVLAQPGHEIYVCEPDPDRPSSAATWNRDEFLAATGQTERTA